MFSYRVFGLTLAAAVELPLNRCERDRGPVDYRIDFSSDVHASTVAFTRSEPLYVSRHHVNGEPGVAVWRGKTESEHIFRFHDGIAFVVDRERGLVACHCATDELVRDASHHLLISLMGFLLASRDAVSLHGAAIRFDDGVVVLLGRPRSGKTIVAMELAALGADVLSDELVAVRSNAGICTVSRGYPWASVRTAAEGFMTYPAVALGPPWRYIDDSYRSWPLPSHVANEDATDMLKLICILSPRLHGKPSIGDVSPREACMAVMEAAARTRIPLPGLARRELDVASQLASSVPAVRLEYQVSNGGLSQALQMALVAQPST